MGNVNALRAENARRAQEIESLKTRLAAAEAKNRRADDMIYGKFRKDERHLLCKFTQGNLSFKMCSCLTGCLTGLRPESRGPMKDLGKR